jgi:hypothetical protein
MRKRITKLTQGQENRLVELRQECLAHGLSTEPADRARAEAAFARAYERIGRAAVPVVWVDSPARAHLKITNLKNPNYLGSIVRHSLRPEEAMDSISGFLGGGVFDTLRYTLWSSIRILTWDNVGMNIRDDLMREYPSDTCPIDLLGQHDLYWVAFYLFCDEIGVHLDPNVMDGVDIAHEIGQSCMWWYAFDSLIIACERPAVICVDDRERLHSETGPAVEFRDGRKIHAIHGRLVPNSKPLGARP